MSRGLSFSTQTTKFNMMATYKYIVFDAQYLLTRNFKQKINYVKETDPYIVNGEPLIKDGKTLMKKEPNWETSDLVTVFFQSIAKFVRDYASAEKVILCWDKYPYHKFDYLKDYKGDRHYETEDDKSGLDPIDDAEEIINLDLKIEELRRKQEAKYWIIQNLGKVGLVSYIKTGYEADDYAAALVKYLYRTEPNSKVAIVSSDSDWDYLLLPNAVHLKPRGGEPITYDSMIKRHQDIIESSKLSLYQFKSIFDAVYGSHNFLKSTLDQERCNNEKLTIVELYKKLMNGDTSYLLDVDLFKAQLKSFDFESYPEYENVVKSFYYLDKSGKILDAVEYSLDADLQTMLKSNVGYYTKFASTLNPNLYNKI